MSPSPWSPRPRDTLRIAPAHLLRVLIEALKQLFRTIQPVTSVVYGIDEGVAPAASLTEPSEPDDSTASSYVPVKPPPPDSSPALIPASLLNTKLWDSAAIDALGKTLLDHSDVFPSLR